MSGPIVTPFDPSASKSSPPANLLPATFTPDIPTALPSWQLPGAVFSSYPSFPASIPTSLSTFTSQNSSWTTSQPTSSSTTLIPTNSHNSSQPLSTGGESVSRPGKVNQPSETVIDPKIIAGIVAGAVVFIIILAGCMFYLGQRYRRKGSEKLDDDDVDEKGFKQELDGYAMDYDSKNRRNRAIVVTEEPQELAGDFGLAIELPDDEKFKHAVYLRELPANDRESRSTR